MTLCWAILSRKRKRSRPRSRSGSRISSPRAAPSSMRPPPDSIRFIYRIDSKVSKGYEWFIVSIPTEQLKFLDEVEDECYTRHDHHRCDPTRFRPLGPTSFLRCDDLIGFSSVSVVGSYAYSLVGVDLVIDLQFWSYPLDDESESRSSRLLPPPLCPTRHFSTFFSLRGKVYLLGGLAVHSQPPTQSFAEVYDPETEQWSDLPQPPDADVLNTRMSLFILSLGHSVGKIMVYDFDTPVPRFYYYDVVASRWTSRLPPPSLCFEPQFIYGTAVINEDDHNLYWIDRRLGFLYGFDWMANQLFSGPIVGMEHVPTLIHINNLSGRGGVTLHHLWGDFFCLIWCIYLDWLTLSFRSEYHFTFLRVIKGPCRGSLTAFVIGCFMDSDYNRTFISDAIRA